MGKVAQNSAKYVIEAKLESNGIVEKPDVVGAIFGQTEGLLGEDLDLRELQERGRIGRINVDIKKSGGSEATITIPSSLNAVDTSLVAAALETIDRVGPTHADISIKEIRDERVSKRDYIVKRAKQLLRDLQDDAPQKQEISDEIKEEIRQEHIAEYKNFPAGPEVQKSDEVILVEGRADVLNLMKHGVKNAVALGGSSVPENITEITDTRTVTAYLDGDRGGDLILKELKQIVEPDYVARAPDNKEVEELGKEEIYKALRDRRPLKYTDTDVEEEEQDPELMARFDQYLSDLVGTRAVFVLDEDMETKEKMPVSAHSNIESESGFAVIFDGEVDRDMVEMAENIGADYIVGMSKDGYASSSDLRILTKEDIKAGVTTE